MVSAVSQVVDMVSGGRSKDEIDAIVESWELSEEGRTELLEGVAKSIESALDAMESAEATAKAADEMQAATAMSLDATTQSHASITVAMETSTTAAQQTMQVAQKSVEALDQVLGQQAQLIATVQRQQGYIDALNFEIQNLKV